MTQDVTPTPAVVRRLDSTSAMAMADLAAIFEDLQTTLRCCERLMSELAAGEAKPDDLTLEAFWTTAMLSYARCSRTAKVAPTSNRTTSRRQGWRATYWAGTRSCFGSATTTPTPQ